MLSACQGDCLVELQHSPCPISTSGRVVGFDFAIELLERLITEPKRLELAKERRKALRSPGATGRLRTDCARNKIPAMADVESLLKQTLGRPFEIECPTVRITGRHDFEEPFFKGPGILRGGIDGPIEFRIFDDLPHSLEDNARILKALNSREPMRLFATDLDFTEWSGAWFSPSLGFDTGRDTVSGTFPQLCTRVKLAAGSEERNSIALYYVENLSLPRPEPIKISAGDTVQKSPKRFDLHSIDRNGLRIVFSDNLEFGGTQVIAKTHPDLSPPIAEMALAESVEYILCRPCRPRVTVRYFEDGALVFIRECRVKPRTGLPSPLRGSPAEILSIWDVFYTFLGQYFNRTEFAPPETSRILQEVIRASTGTVHTFAASLVLGVEGLTQQIFKGQPSETDPQLERLRQYISCWDGPTGLKDRVLGLMSMAATPSTASLLTRLKSQGVVTESQIKVWKELRPKIAHGNVIDYADEKLWQNQDLLISMFHRLVLRLIGYKGPITDFSTDDLRTIELNWYTD
jgi:hypothetical protein